MLSHLTLPLEYLILEVPEQIIGKDLGACSEVLYFELTGERYVMTFLNVLNFGDQGKCDGVGEWWQSFLSHSSSCGSENDLKCLKIA